MFIKYCQKRRLTAVTGAEPGAALKSGRGGGDCPLAPCWLRPCQNLFFNIDP